MITQDRHRASAKRSEDFDMTLRNIGLIFRREVADQFRDRRTLFMIAVLPVLLYPALGIGMMQMTVLFS